MPTNSEERLALSVIIQALKDVSSCESAKAFLTNKDDEWEEHRDLIASITNVNGDWVLNNVIYATFYIGAKEKNFRNEEENEWSPFLFPRETINFLHRFKRLFLKIPIYIH